MTTVAFRALLNEARAAHARHPAIAGFCAFPDDLRETPHRPFHIPAADLMAADPALRGARLHPLARAFAAAGPEAHWRQTCTGTTIGEDFIDRFGCYCLIGTGAPWTSAAMHAFVVYMPPHLHDPWHHHPAEEVYLVLAGEAEFLREGAAPETLGPGDTAFHAANRPHAAETRNRPLLAHVLWRNHFATPPVLTGRAVAQ